ncbi:TIGR02234 family membrane protein [Tsukamurella sp. PLM1]|uniref:TIGR02234 family membrane protein n=1 Tax=Tsukamurella sp. PLM1 TaxID=2929795 RepID=UPI0020450F81|nr:TIGR02234 family membrane protein [Tsukamurella sp. PLM1]BDH57341.1 membrane protein [Tsukamurella sp. PLM1]
MNAKRNLAVACVLLAIAAGAVWGASRMSWMHVIVADGLSPERTMDVAGHTWAPALNALPLVFLAAIPAALALKGWARAVVAVVVAASAVGTGYPALQVLTQEPDVRYIETILDLARKDYLGETDKVLAGPLLAVAGAAVAVVAAALLMRGTRGGGMGSKYQSPAARRAELEQRVFDGAAAEPASERELWDALDGGGDPTTGTGEGAAPDRPGPEG